MEHFLPWMRRFANVSRKYPHHLGVQWRTGEPSQIVTAISDPEPAAERLRGIIGCDDGGVDGDT